MGYPNPGSGAVTSVFTRTGAVAAANGDYYGIVAAALTGATAASRYVGATASGAPASGTFLKGDFTIDQTGKAYVCTVAGSPGTWVEIGATGPVTSVFSRTGAVVAAANDYDYSKIAASAGAVAISNLADPTTGKVIGSVSNAAAAVYPPGYEYAYVEKTTDTNITATSQATADTVLTAASITVATGDTLLFTFFSPSMGKGTTWIKPVLYEDSTAIKDLGYFLVAGQQGSGMLRRAPSAGSYIYTLRAYVDAGTGYVGATGFAPCFLQITRV